MLRIDLNLVWTIINVIILYLLLKKFLIKPVTAIMDKREQMVKQGLEGARAQESQAKELKVKYEEALASAKEMPRWNMTVFWVKRMNRRKR